MRSLTSCFPADDVIADKSLACRSGQTSLSQDMLTPSLVSATVDSVSRPLLLQLFLSCCDLQLTVADLHCSLDRYSP